MAGFGEKNDDVNLAYIQSVEAFDPPGVARALRLGAAPESWIADDVNPLWYTLTLPYEDRPDKQMTQADFNRAKDDIIDLIVQGDLLRLLSHDPDAGTVVSGEVIRGGRSGADANAFFLAENHYNTAKIILYRCLVSLQTTGRPFYVDFSGLANPQQAERNAYEVLLVARSFLEDPETDVEKVLLHLYEDEVGLWLQSGMRQESPTTIFGRHTRHSGWNFGAKEASEENDAQPGFVQMLPRRDPYEVMAEIERDFVGLEDVKKNLQSLFFRQKFDAVRKAAGKASVSCRHSSVMVGNPGLGKTTLARKKAELLHALGLAGPRYVEVTRENLVGEHIGKTEAKMKELWENADIVFIDEAYNLVVPGSKKDFGRHVVDSLLTSLENRPEMVVFLAGYPDEMATMLSANPGILSRIVNYESFPDMDRDALGRVLDLMLAQADLTIEDAARVAILDKLEEARTALGDKNFGNARLVRNVVSALPDVLARRFFADIKGPQALPSAEEISHITGADVVAADLDEVLGLKAMGQNKAAVKPIGFFREGFPGRGR